MARALRPGAVALAAAFCASAQAQAPACGTAVADGRRAESARYTVVYAPLPASIEVSRHFSLAVAVCAKAGVPAPGALRVSATMPEHGHGMNYRVSVKPLGSGRFQADGLMFHMPGRWQLAFDVDGAGGTERLLHDILLR